MSKQAVAYLRVSTEDQRLGPDAQMASIESYAKSQGIEILAVYLDRGVSGAASVEDRPGLSGALEHVRARKADLLIAKRDRLARDVLISTLVERSLPKGCQVLSADNTANGDQPQDLLMRTILDGMSAYERALIRQRTKAALQSLKAKGKRAGNVPFGYQADESGSLSPDPEEQLIISRIRVLRSQGVSLRQIVRALEAEGHKNRADQPVKLVQVARVLRSAA